MAEANALLHDAVHIRRFVVIAESSEGHVIGQLSDELQPHWPAPPFCPFLASLCVAGLPARDFDDSRGRD